MKMKKFTRLSLLLALSVVLNLIESIVPVFNGSIPGLKIGLANVVVLFIIYAYGFKDAMYVSILRVILVGILRTGVFNIPFFFSMGGASLSTITMYLCYKLTKLSMIGVSIVGSITHSIGQIIVAIILLNQTGMVYYLPYLLLFSIPTGIFTGIIAKQMLESFDTILNEGISYY